MVVWSESHQRNVPDGPHGRSRALLSTVSFYPSGTDKWTLNKWRWAWPFGSLASCFPVKTKVARRVPAVEDGERLQRKQPPPSLVDCSLSVPATKTGRPAATSETRSPHPVSIRTTVTMSRNKTQLTSTTATIAKPNSWSVRPLAARGAGQKGIDICGASQHRRCSSGRKEAPNGMSHTSRRIQSSYE